PQVRLRYPAYTDLSPQDAPDGASSIEAVAGTEVTLRAATDRPLSRAWLEIPAELAPSLSLSAFLTGLGSRQPLALAAALAVAGRPAARQIPARLDADGRVLMIEFTARVSGSYVLHFEDDSSLGSTRLIEVLVAPDPTPTVTLERPSHQQDSFEVL